MPRALPGFVEHETGPTDSMTIRLGLGAGPCRSRGKATESGHLRDRAAWVVATRPATASVIALAVPARQSYCAR